jgi:hypothetical protein
MTEPAAPEPTAEELAKKKAANRKVNFWIAGVGIAAGLGCGIYATVSHSSSNPAGDRGSNAVAQCESAVKNQLKAPSTAKFSGEDYIDEDPTWLVTGSVDAQNGFGAMLRSGFNCTLTRSGESFIVSQANIDEP